MLVAFLCGDGHGAVETPTILPSLGALEPMVHSAFRDLEKHVMAYMIPKAFLPVSRIPTTMSGKTDRRALRALAASLDGRALRPFSASDKAPAKTSGRAILIILRKLTATQLKIDAPDIGAENNLFRLGGDSLAAIKLAAAARDSRLSLTVADIFKFPTITGMAGAIEGAITSHVEEYTQFSLVNPDTLSGIIHDLDEDYGLDKDSIEDIFPCTPLQEGLMASSLRSGAYISRHILAAPADMDLARFKRAWERTFEHHPTLRTKICHTEDHGMIQAVVRGRIDWHTVTPPAAIEEIPMTLGAPLAQITLLASGSARQPTHFTLSLHHAIYDGWSLPIILEYAQNVYQHSASQPGPEQDEKAQHQPSFGSFLKYITQMDKDATAAYWKHRLDLFEVPEFPAYDREASYSPLANALFEREVKLGSGAMVHTTVPNLIRAAWAMTVVTHCGTSHALFRETLTGRNAPVVEIY